MKKYLFILLILTGCKSSCILSQIPPQFIYAGIGCSASIPDYRTKITVTDNCQIASYTQIPAPGYILSPPNMNTQVTIKATDASGNFRQLTFSVSIRDTVKPVFVIDPSLLSQNWKTVDRMYDLADAFLKEIARYDKILPVDSLFIPNPIGNSYIGGLTRVRYTTDNISWLVDKNGIGQWITTADGVPVPDTTNKTVIVVKLSSGKRMYSFK